MSRVAIDQMDERHGRGQGTMGRKNGSCSDAAIATMTWEHGDCLSITPAARTFNLVIDKGRHVLLRSDREEDEYVHGQGGEGTHPLHLVHVRYQMWCLF